LDIIVFISLFATVLAGGGLVLILPDHKRFLKLLLAFSGAYLLSVCVLHLIPEVYATDYDGIGIFILVGFLIQLFLELFSQGIEHGHVHVHGNEKHRFNFPLTLMLSLCVHAFFEGMPLESEVHNHAGHDHANNSLLYGIILHKFPVAIALMSMLLQSGLSKTRAFLWLMLFASMAPLGAFLSHAFGHELVEAVSNWFQIILAVVIGMFLHISTTILFESSEGHKFNIMKFATIIGGGLLAFLTL
jgi:zinc and cadmium transporter